MSTTFPEQVLRLLVDRVPSGFTDTAGLIAVVMLTLLLVEWQSLRILRIDASGLRGAGLDLAIAALAPAGIIVLLVRIVALLPQ